MDVQTESKKTGQNSSGVPSTARPSNAQLKWMARGLSQPGGKLPLFDETGQKVSARTVKSCLRQGWVEPWFENPIKPDWLVCKLTETGRKISDLS